MKPTDKEYPELLATEMFDWKKFPIGSEERTYASLSNLGIRDGYQLALDHTNHAELLEAAKSFIKDATIELLQALRESITKSETSKLK